ncbi:MAG: glycosyltransferase family 4 protein [Lentisphaeria bacterium]|nr:glycosyltransferase family 4 protein [Lentisphaeria bacterium]
MKAAFDGSVVRRPYAGVQFSVLAEMRAVAAALGALDGCLFLCADEGLAADLAPQGASVLRPPAWTGFAAGRILWQQAVLPGLLRRRGLEVLHALAYTAPRRCPLPYVLNVHDVIALDRPGLCAPLNRLHMRWLLPESIRGAGVIVVSTRHVADRVQRLFGMDRTRIEVAPLGVDPRRFAAPLPVPQVAGMAEDRPYFLFVGNIEPKKDIGTLLDAYAAGPACAAADLVLAGRAAWLCRDVVARLRSWPGPGRVHWLGRVDDDRVVALLQHAVALVMPSIEEGFGMPVLEGMAAGTAVIHSDHPALREAAGQAGLQFPRGDARALALQFRRLLESPYLRQELVQAGRAHAACMTWRRWGEAAAYSLQRALATRLGTATDLVAR